MARIKSKRFTGVYLNKLANGDISYSITYKDAAGKMQRVTIGKKSEGVNETYAHIKRNEIIGKLRLGEVPEPLARKLKREAITIDKLADVYFEDKKSSNKYNAKQRGRYELHIKPVLGHRDINTVTKADVQKLQNSLATKKQPNTVNSVITLLRAIIYHGTDKLNLKVANPCSSFKPLPVDDKRQRYLLLDEIDQLIEAVRDDTVLYHFVKMALTTGARLESLVHIKKKDLRFDMNRVTIHDLKSGGNYDGYYSDAYKTELQAHTAAFRPNDYIISIDGRKTPSRTIQRHLKPILDQLFNEGLDTRDAKNRVVIHTLRHTFASQLAIAGTPIYTIQTLMNHKSIKHTARYAKLAPDQGKDEVQRVFK